MDAHDLTRGPIRRHVLRMGAPMLVAMLVNNLYQLADVYWLSLIGEHAVAALSIVFSLMIVIMALGQVLSVGTVALVAQAAGRRDLPAVRRLFHQSLGLALCVSALVAAPAFLVRNVLAGWIAGDAQTAATTGDLLAWFAPALGLTLPMLVLAAALRAVGDVRTAVRVQLGAVIANIGVAPLLIFGPGPLVGMGSTGSGAAALLTIGIALSVLIRSVLRRGVHLGLAAADWRPRLADWRSIVRIGLPSGSEFGLMALFFGFVMWVLRDFGAEAQAAFGIGMRWMQLGTIPALAIGFAAAAVAGQNFGAGSLPRVQAVLRTAALTGLCATAFACGVYQLFPQALIGLFSDDPRVLDVGVGMMRVLTFNLLAASLVLVTSGVFSGLGRTLPPLLSSLLRYGLVIATIATLLYAGDFEIELIWWLTLGGTALQAALNLWLIRRLLRRIEVSPAGEPVPA